MARTVSLVLGGGGARGYAHIGVIEELEKAGFEIVSICGCSMGALVGGIYAAGNLQAYKEWALGLDFVNVLSLVDLTLSSGGMIKGERVFEKMAPFFGNKKIEELPIKFTAVATDLNAKKEVWFQQGDLQTAIRASIAIPTIFTPVYLADRLLVDGGVLNPLPIAPTMSDHTDLRIAVNLNASHVRPLRPVSIPKEEIKKQDQAVSGFRSLLEKIGFSKNGKPHKAETQEAASRLDILSRTLDTMQESLTLYKIAGYSPDILVQIPMESCRTYDFHKAYQMIEIGREAAWKALDKYETQLKSVL